MITVTQDEPQMTSGVFLVQSAVKKNVSILMFRINTDVIYCISIYIDIYRYISIYIYTYRYIYIYIYTHTRSKSNALQSYSVNTAKSQMQGVVTPHK